MNRWICLCELLLAVSVAQAADVDSPSLGWPNRFGPTSNGHVAPGDAQGLPVSFDESTGRNILWKMPLSDHGLSTPVILHGKVWLTSASEDGTQQYVDCIDAESGDVLHHRLLFENTDPEPLGNPVNTYASPSCVVTDDAVYAHFGTYGTARLNPKTLDVVWQRRDINCRHFRGPGSSPVLHDNLLILTFDGIDQQFLTALDINTGDTVWRTERSTDYEDLDENGRPERDGDLRKAYSTPGVIDVDGRAQVISVGSRAAFGYDAETGREIWTVRHADFNASSPPCFFSGMVLLHTGSRTRNLIAIRLDETTLGDVTESHEVWNRDQGNSQMSSPVLKDGLVFMLTDNGVALCVNAATGERVNRVRLGSVFVSSPIVANDYLYACSEDGTMTVLRANGTLEVVAKSRLSDGMRASPAAADGRLYLRTFSDLYCIGDK